MLFVTVIAASPVGGCGGDPGQRSNAAVPEAGAAAATPVTSAAAACELLTAAEVAGFLRVPAVYVDSIESGFNETTRVDLCSWYVTKGESDGVMVKLRRSASADEVLVQFAAAKIDAGFRDAPEPASGIGDEALYGPYPDRTGGTIVFRKGASAVTILGSLSKETLISAAKAALPRI